MRYVIAAISKALSLLQESGKVCLFFLIANSDEITIRASCKDFRSLAEDSTLAVFGYWSLFVWRSRKGAVQTAEFKFYRFPAAYNAPYKGIRDVFVIVA